MLIIQAIGGIVGTSGKIRRIRNKKNKGVSCVSIVITYEIEYGVVAMCNLQTCL